MRENYKPPPCELLAKRYTNDEGIRTGFNQGFIPYKIKDNVERGKYPQGPQIVVTTQAQVNAQQPSKTSKDFMKRHHRSKSRDPVLGSQMEPKLQNEAENADLADFKEVINTTVPNSETSLRHLFYLEYKKQF